MKIAQILIYNKLENWTFEEPHLLNYYRLMAINLNKIALWRILSGNHPPHALKNYIMKICYSSKFDFFIKYCCNSMNINFSHQI